MQQEHKEQTKMWFVRLGRLYLTLGLYFPGIYSHGSDFIRQETGKVRKLLIFANSLPVAVS